MNVSNRMLALTMVALGAIALTGCGRGGDAKAAQKDGGPTIVGAESAYKVEKQQISTGPRISGSLEAKKLAVLRAETAGSVTEVKAELGDAVKAGQVLARIEDTALRDAFSSAQSGLVSAEQEASLSQKQLERTQSLVKAGALSARDLELAQSAATSATARLSDARARAAASKKQLDAATVQAPFAGVVSQRAVNQGDVVAPGAPLFSVIDPSSMRLSASFPSDEVGLISVGKEVQFEVRGYPNQTFTGQIERIAPAADPATRQIPVLVSIPNEGGRLIAGLFAEGRVAVQSRDTLVVPFAAIDTEGSEPHVLRVKDGKTEAVKVKLGLRDERSERAEVLAGLNPGDVVLTGAARTLAPGTPVELGGKTTASAR